MEIFLDRNPTHKAKMQSIYQELTESLAIETRFHLISAYSPTLNLVEYVIHLVRQKILHHADHKTDLVEFESKIRSYCEAGKIITKDQIINILEHIEGLVPDL